MKQLKLFPIQKFCMDADVLINLKHYPKDIFAPMWDKIENMIKKGEIISHIEVFEEIKTGEDEIYEWCKRRHIKKMFKDVDDCQIAEINKVEEKYNREVWERNASKPHWADPWLIALAICEEAMIVTNEANRAWKIPFIANYFNIKTLSLFDFFRKVGIKWEK